MTAYEVYLKTIKLLGYDAEQNTAIGDKLQKTAMTAISAVLEDLGFRKIVMIGSDTEIAANEKISEALPYGVAMFVCSAIGDSEKQAFFTDIYNSKRTRCRAKTEKIKDIFTRGMTDEI